MLRAACLNPSLTNPRTQRSPLEPGTPTPPPPTQDIGYFSLLAFWIGGAGA